MLGLSWRTQRNLGQDRVSTGRIEVGTERRGYQCGDSHFKMKSIALSIGILLAWGGPAWAADRLVGPSEKPAGSGVIVHSDGYVLTAHHVVANAKRIVAVTPGEFRAPAVLVSADPEHDLALLKVETVGLSEAAIGYAGAVRLDQEVLAVGFQFGLREVSVTRGRIAAVRTKGVRRVFQVDAAINPGSSGGPVFNKRGEVVGIVTTKFSHPSGIAPEGMGFSVPITYATPLLANIPEFDFSSIGRHRSEAAGELEARVEDLARTTVRIETVRFQESGAGRALAPASSGHLPVTETAKGQAGPQAGAHTPPAAGAHQSK